MKFQVFVTLKCNVKKILVLYRVKHILKKSNMFYEHNNNASWHNFLKISDFLCLTLWKKKWFRTNNFANKRLASYFETSLWRPNTFECISKEKFAGAQTNAKKKVLQTECSDRTKKIRQNFEHLRSVIKEVQNVKIRLLQCFVKTILGCTAPLGFVQE